MKIEHLITSGCSFTHDGIGGRPPDGTTNGACSFYNYPSANIIAAEPKKWASHLALRYQVISLVNLASSSHGNILVANSILEVLNRFKYNNNTLVVFNITEPGRLDFPCAFDHPDACEYVPWSQDIIPYSFLSVRTKLYEKLRLHQGIEQVECMSANAINFLFNFLENQQVPYAFMMLSDYTNHRHLGPVVDSRLNHCIKFDKYLGMAEFCAANNANSGDGWHPDDLGHVLMTDYVQEHIIKFYGP